MMKQQAHDMRTTRLIVGPGFVDGALAAGSVEQITLAAQPLLPQIVLSVAEVKKLLRLLPTPWLLTKHRLAQHFQHLPPARRGAYLVELVQAAIQRLEWPSNSGKPDTRGVILRLRYLEQQKACEARAALFLSESHFHRLQAAALQHLAELLSIELSLCAEQSSRQ